MCRSPEHSASGRRPSCWYQVTFSGRRRRQVGQGQAIRRSVARRGQRYIAWAHAGLPGACHRMGHRHSGASRCPRAACMQAARNA
eukprot:6018565-Pyramimonas_sp.AAC.1